MRMIQFSPRNLLFILVVVAISTAAFSQIGISVRFGPPALPIYEQPVCPGDGYIWTPGYWAWDGDDYYWVPGTWVEAPEVGYLWTPPWWGWSDGVYLFHEGWWGPHVGFYGGVVYGFGYFGVGFEGGRWDGGHFFYNRSVTNVNVINIHNVYNETIVTRYTDNHISFNGGPGGIAARASADEQRWDHERHIGPVNVQTQHMQAARGNPELHAADNHGRPAIAATARPGEFRGSVVAAREAGAPYNPPNRGGNASHGGGNAPSAVHPKELPAFERPAAPNTGDANRDRKYQQQQDKMFAKQEQERQQLQQKQEQEHQRLDQQKANEAQRQQTEQRHQQQTQQLQQKHQQQQQRMQERQQPQRKK